MLVLAVARSARAAPLADDFESGTTLTTSVPAGQWDAYTQGSGGETLDVAASAAHRGAFGLRLGDTSAGGAGTYSLSHAEPNLTTDYYARMWLQVASVTTPVSALSVGGIFSGLNQQCTAELGLKWPGPVISSDGFSLPAGTSFSDSSPAVSTGAWHLIEWGLTGVGTSAGTRTLWIDGVVGATRAVDLTGGRIDGFQLGQLAGPAPFQGVLLFDDVRTSPTPPASRFSLAAPVSAIAGACVPITVSLRDSRTLGLAAAPYDVVATLTAAGATGLFSLGGSCATPVSTVSIPFGSSSVPLFFQAGSAGTAALTASQVDFLTSPQATVTVTAAGQGGSCSVPGQCSSGNCVGGVCCNAPCTGSCQACALAGGATADGTCTDLPATVVCRPAAGVCDQAETCTGASGACPADLLVGAGVSCRPIAGGCDLEETCTGTSAQCPVDAFQPTTSVCRGSTGLCDQLESCTGASAACPPDAVLSAGASCSSPSCMAGQALLETFCDGSAKGCPTPQTVTCPAMGCDGTSCAGPVVIVREATLTATRGVAYPYSPHGAVRAQGSAPITFSGCLAVPGLSIDASTGALQWTPQAPGDQPLCVQADNAFSQDQYRFTVAVADAVVPPTPPEPPTPLPPATPTPRAPLAVGCGCQSGGGAGALLGLVVALWARQRQRRL